MGRHDMVWPAARPVEEVSVFARWTSEGAAPKDRPPLFSRAGSKSWAGRRPLVAPGDLRDVPRMQGTRRSFAGPGLYLPRDSISLGLAPRRRGGRSRGSG
jgi:hypothetical protein